MVCDEAPSLHLPTEYTTLYQPQTNSSPSGASHLDDWKWLPPNPNYDRFLWAKSNQSSNNSICTISNKQHSCDSPTKATTTQKNYGLQRITNPVQYSKPIKEETHHDTPSTAPDVPTTSNPAIRIDHRSCPSRTHMHGNDRADPNLENTGDLGMDIEQKTSDRGMDLGPPESPPTMTLD